MSAQSVQDASIGPLEQEIQQLQHTVMHLERSNAELRQHLESEGFDRECKEAIQVDAGHHLVRCVVNIITTAIIS